MANKPRDAHEILRHFIKASPLRRPFALLRPRHWRGVAAAATTEPFYRVPATASEEAAVINIQEIALDDLPRWSNWPARLLGLERFDPPVRTTDKITQEFGREKWQFALDAFEKSGRTLDATALRAVYYARGGVAPLAAVHRGKLVAARTPAIIRWHDDLLAEWMGPIIREARTVVELGAGFGYVLWSLRERFPGKLYRGGEYTDTAVELANKLYAEHPEISIERVNFYDSEYAVLDKAEGPVVVLTSQAIEQIPDCRCIIDTLTKHKNKIAAVFHIEPAYDLLTPTTLLGQMRRRYLEINDYNRNLFGTLKTRADIRIVRLEQDVIGWNPFNSLAIVHWEFAK